MPRAAPRNRKRRPDRVKPRKEPSQDRARHTVEAILQAACAVLVRDGFDRASTNRIAEEAGVSIGSLYQYFPSKESVVQALVDRHEQRMLAVMRDHLEDVTNQDIPTAVRALIEALLSAHRVDPKLQKVLLEHQGSRHDSSVEATIEALVRGALDARRADLGVEDLDAAAFVLVTAVRTSCHRAVVERPDLLKADGFVDELTRMVVRYLETPQRPRASGHRPRSS